MTFTQYLPGVGEVEHRGLQNNHIFLTENLEIRWIIIHNQNIINYMLLQCAGNNASNNASDDSSNNVSNNAFDSASNSAYNIASNNASNNAFDSASDNASTGASHSCSARSWRK